jgi:hypothetical protein
MGAKSQSLDPSASLMDVIDEIQSRVASIEGRFSEMGYTTKTLVQTEIKTRWKVPAQALTLFGLQLAICVDTIDPWGQGRVRWFSPHLLNPENTVTQLPWATPISAMGGFDDSGLNWVPPAGSKLCLIFENGERDKAFYIGTTWDRDIGPTGNHAWDYPMPEYDKIHDGTRGGYVSGKNDGSQNFPPWNTTNYNHPDIDDISQFRDSPDAQIKITYPHRYGFKTPQKHMVILDDGNYKCNHRWSRIEMQTGCGGTLLFKDDNLHPSGQWLDPECECESTGDVSICNDADGNPTANAFYQKDFPECANPFHKHSSECRPYKGVGTPQNNRIDLPQSGFQIISISGHTLYANDEVEQPFDREVNWWGESFGSSNSPLDRTAGLWDFKFGETDKCLCETGWISTTGHKIWMNDVEIETNIRSEENGIFLKTATGNYIAMNDHTTSCQGSDGQAGAMRGIFMQSTSDHTFEMADVDNLQCMARKEGGIPENSATNAYVKLRTGYGLELMMADFNTQEEECQRQFIQLFCPQYDVCSGPHFIRMQEDPEAGQIQVRAGGDYVLTTSMDYYAVIGTDKESAPTGFNVPINQGDIPSEWSQFCFGGCKGPRNWITVVSRNSFHASCAFYLNVAETHLFQAKNAIYLLAGEDVNDPDGEGCVPSMYPVLVLQGNRIVASTRVMASAEPGPHVCSIFELRPFVSDEPLPGCTQ